MSDDLGDDTPKAPSRLPLILGVVGALVVGASGGVGGAYFLFGEASAHGPEAVATDEGHGGVHGTDAESSDHDPGGHGGGHGAEAAPAKKKSSGPVIEDLGKFTVNLRGGGGGRVLRMEVALEVAPDGEDLVAQNHVMLRDSVITLASDYSYGDLEGLDGKTRLRDELLGRMNSSLESASVRRVYFTDFAVQ